MYNDTGLSSYYPFHLSPFNLTCTADGYFKHQATYNLTNIPYNNTNLQIDTDLTITMFKWYDLGGVAYIISINNMVKFFKLWAVLEIKR